MNATISAIAHHLPLRIRTNAEIAARLGVTEEWIVQRTGIRERRVADSGGTSELVVPAAVECLRRVGVPAEEIDCVVIATITPDHPTPATAIPVIRQIGATAAWGFDLSAACSGFVYGLAVAAGLVETGRARRVLVAGADRMSCATDLADRRTAILLGDAAGVALVERSADPATGLRDFLLRTDPRGESEVRIPAGGSVQPATPETVAARQHCLYLSGPPVFRAAIEGLTAITAELMARNGLTPANVDWLIPHQANRRIVDAVAERLGFPPDKVVMNIERYGNTSAATIPIALSEWWEAGRLRPGQRVVVCSIGAGYTLGAAYLVWSAAR